MGSRIILKRSRCLEIVRLARSLYKTHDKFNRRLPNGTRNHGELLCNGMYFTLILIKDFNITMPRRSYLGMVLSIRLIVYFFLNTGRAVRSILSIPQLLSRVQMWDKNRARLYACPSYVTGLLSKKPVRSNQVYGDESQLACFFFENFF